MFFVVNNKISLIILVVLYNILLLGLSRKNITYFVMSLVGLCFCTASVKYMASVIVMSKNVITLDESS